MNGLTRALAKKPCWSIFFISLVLLMGLQYKPAILSYTTRLVDFTQYMLAHGMTLFPIADDLQPYPDYTVTNTILEYLASWPFGHVSILSMGLPFCIAGSLTLVFVYKLGALHDQRWGLYGAVFALFTWAFLDGVSYLALDVYPALFTIIGFYLVYSADFKQTRPRLGLVIAALALGFAFRGPVGLVGPTLVVASYYALSKQWQRLFSLLVLAGLTLAAGMGLLTWAAYLEGGHAFMVDVLMMQALGRVANAHGPRYYFYFSVGLITYGVTAFYALRVIINQCPQFFRTLREPETNLLFHLAAWFLALLVLFTIPHSKKLRYIQSITPAIALLAAYVFVDRERVFVRTKEGFIRLCMNLPLIGLGLLLVVFLYGLQASTPWQPNYVGVLGSCGVLLIGRYAFARRLSSPAQRDFLAVMFGLAAFFALDAFLIDAITYHLELAIEPTPKFLPYWFW